MPDMNTMSALRHLLGREPLRLSKADALSIARTKYDRTYGCPLPKPLKVCERLSAYIVATRIDTQPTGPWFEIDGYTGRVRRWVEPTR
jgi:hypothetical protein